MALFKRKRVVHLDPEGWKKKVKKRWTIVVSLVGAILVGLGISHLITKVIIPGKAYGDAEAALASGNIADSIEKFTLLGDYKDAADRAVELAYRECGSSYSYLSDASVGDVVEFGHYEQDGSVQNGPEPIEWVVMMKNRTSMYLMALNVLDEHTYHTQRCDITWADCELRAWLNDHFLNAAFNEKEQLLVAKTKLETANNSVSGAKGGRDTEDKVFIMSHGDLLSIVRAGADIDIFGLYAYPTRVALNNGIESGRHGAAMWWLRTPGISQDSVTIADAKGEPIYVKRANYKGVGVRPCIWVLIDQNDG